MNWHVVHALRGKWSDVRDTLRGLDCITDVLAPHRVEAAKLYGRPIERHVPWLGPLVLARWESEDPHAWHDVFDAPHVIGIIGGWPPAIVPLDQISRLLRSIQMFENNTQIIGAAPCGPGAIVRFTYLAFYRLIGRCVWVDDHNMQVGLQLSMLGRDDNTIVPVPWSAVEQPDGNVVQFRRDGNFS